MTTRTGLFISMIFVLGLSWTVLDSHEAAACSCLPPDISRSYNSNDDVFEGRVIREVRHRHRRVVYTVRVQRTYKGCLERGAVVRVVSSRSTAACGVTGLEKGKTYLLHGNLNARGHMRINSCDYNRETTALIDSDRAYLDSRYNCCGDSCGCVSSDEVACIVDPCSVAPSCSEAAACVPNYCGGCNAEFYNTSGEQVCVEFSCQSDDDCSAGNWCRPTQPGQTNLCVPYRGEGEYCGGYTPIWAENRCSPDLVCSDFHPLIPDAPGVCRTSCEDNADCDETGYCSPSNSVCREDGSCFTDQDCEAYGNNYVHILCVGYGVCGDQGRCGWECGNPACRDLSEAQWTGEFGFCDLVLGYGIVDGECAAISGCDSGGNVLHDSMRACQAACMMSSFD